MNEFTSAETLDRVETIDGNVAVEPATASDPGGRASPRPCRRRGRGWVRVGILAGLVGLTAWNATRSRALVDSREAERRGEFPTALRLSLEHLERRPWSREAALRAGRNFSRLDFAAEAEPYYARVPWKSTEDRHYRIYGLVRSRQGDMSLGAYRELLEDHPNDLTALRMTAGLLIAKGRWLELKELAKRIIAMPPGPAAVFNPIPVNGRWTLWPGKVATPQAFGHATLGLAYHDNREPGPAVQEFEKALEIDPELGSIPMPKTMFWAYLATDLLRLGRSEDVIQHLGENGAAGNEPELLNLLARAYLQQTRLAEAEACWLKVREQLPDHPGALLNLGRLELNRGRPEVAIGHLERAAEIEPRSFETAYSLSRAYQQLGRNDDAARLKERSDRLRVELNAQPQGGMGAPAASHDPEVGP